MSAMGFLGYLATHHLKTSAGILGAINVLIEAAATDPVLHTLIGKWLDGSSLDITGIVEQLVCEHPEAVGACSGALYQLSGVAKTDPELKTRIRALLEGK